MLLILDSFAKLRMIILFRLYYANNKSDKSPEWIESIPHLIVIYAISRILAIPYSNLIELLKVFHQSYNKGIKAF